MMEKFGFGLSRGPSEAAKHRAIEAVDAMTAEYRKAEEEIARLQMTPESDEKDAALTVQYGKKRLAENRLREMGVEIPPSGLQ